LRTLRHLEGTLRAGETAVTIRNCEETRTPWWREGEQSQGEGGKSPGGFDLTGVLTFGSYAARFLAGFAKANNKSSELRHKAWAFNTHLIPLLGSRLLCSLTKSDGEWLKVQLKERGLASKSANNVLTMAKTMLYLAVDDDLLPKNPWARVRRNRLQKRGGWDYWTRKESETFLRQVRADAPALFPIFLTLLRTGMRIGEVAGLFWEDVDFGRGEIQVRRQYSSEREWGTLKDEDERLVGLSPQLAAALTAHKAKTYEREPVRVKIGDHEQAGRLVFINKRGGPITSDTLKKARDKACVRAQVKRIRIHDFRHTVGTQLRRQGVSCEDIAELFGHADTQMTERYAHIMPEVRLRTVHLLDDAAHERAAVGMTTAHVLGLLDGGSHEDAKVGR